MRIFYQDIIQEILRNALWVHTTLKSEDINLVFSNASRNKILPTQVNVELLTFDESQGFETVKKIDVKELITAQKDDEVIGPVYNMLSLNERLTNAKIKGLSRASQLLLRQNKKLTLEKGVLIRKTVSVSQIVLPKIYNNLVYEELPKKMGHLGSEKVVELVRKRFYWPYMKKEIEFYIRNKCRCIMSKKPNIPDKACLIPINATFPL